MKKKFFIRRFNLPFFKTKWGIVEVRKDSETFCNPCLIVEKGLCLDIAMERFLTESDTVSIFPAKRKKTEDGFVFISGDGSVVLNVEGFYENLYALKTYSRSLKHRLELCKNLLE
jgi:hypothetical protein